MKNVEKIIFFVAIIAIITLSYYYRAEIIHACKYIFDAIIGFLKFVFWLLFFVVLIFINRSGQQKAGGENQDNPKQ